MLVLNHYSGAGQQQARHSPSTQKSNSRLDSDRTDGTNSQLSTTELLAKNPSELDRVINSLVKEFEAEPQSEPILVAQSGEFFPPYIRDDLKKQLESVEGLAFEGLAFWKKGGRSKVIDGRNAEKIKKGGGYIYTKRCGWIDLSHAKPGIANGLLDQVLNEKNNGGANTDYFRVEYEQNMSWRNLIEAETSKQFDVKRGLNDDQKRSVALAIFLEVAHEFEGMQGNWLYRHVTNSGFSAEDLVSDLIGFYRAAYPSKEFITLCEPVSKADALKVWDTYGDPGTNKNYSTDPYMYPIPPVQGDPMRGQLPVEFTTITPAAPGGLFKEVN